ncbi:hypothetical protein [Streptomyces luteogriseus]|uniref:hypothetical protein n=1 Tax=Streptomyces luteogriseus TaxID=68233 RepID=UPI00379BB71B
MQLRHIAATAAITALALTACSSNDSSDKPADPKKLDSAASLACDDFAQGYKAADTQQERLDLAHKVNKWAPTSKTSRIADSGKILANGAAGSDGSWKLAADTFAQACLDAGWEN